MLDSFGLRPQNDTLCHCINSHSHCEPTGETIQPIL